MRKKVGIIKRLSTLGLVFLLSMNSFAAIVSDNDGSAFITKSEFDALRSSFQAQIDSYNQSIDSKIDGAIASYLAGIKLSTTQNMEYAAPQKVYKTLDTTNFPSTKDGAATYYKLRGGLILATGTQLNGTVEFDVKNNKTQDTLFWLNDAPFEFKTAGLHCEESDTSLGNAVVIPANSTKTIHCNIGKNKDLYFRFGIKPGSGWQNILPGAEIEFVGDIVLTATD